MTDPKIERPSLADAFKNSGGSRAAGLTGLLPKPAATPTPTTVAPPLPSPAPAAKPEPRAAEKTPARQSPERPQAAPRPVPAEHEGVQNVAVYLEADILAAVRAAKTRDVAPGDPDKTYDEVLVDALEHISLDELREHFAVTATTSGGGPLQRRTRRIRGSGGIQIQLRLDGAQRRALDELVTAAGAPSRSALVAVAYRLHLTGDRSAS